MACCPPTLETCSDGSSRDSDQRLVWLARAGDNAAFAILLQRHTPAAQAVAHRLVGNGPDAAEVFQEASWRAYQGLDRLKEPASFRAWFLRMVANQSLNFRRARATARRHLPVERPAAPLDHQAHRGANGPESRLSARELSQALDQAMQRLPSIQRRALLLFSVEQLPQRDVAARLGCSVAMVKWYVFQARRRLRSELDDRL